MSRLTDKRAIAIALHLAIEVEESLIDAYRNVVTREVPEGEEGVVIARRRIEAFKRVQARYGLGAAEPLATGKPISVWELLRPSTALASQTHPEDGREDA